MNYFLLMCVFCGGLLGCTSSDVRAPITDITLKSSARSKQIPTAQQLKTYKVKMGDTLYAIAWKAELDVNMLIKFNHIKSPYLIYEGQILNLTEKKHHKYQSPRKSIIKTKSRSRKSGIISSTNEVSQKKTNKDKRKIVDKKVRIYAVSPNKKTALKTQVKSTKVMGKKINHWFWPAKGKLTESFSVSKTGMKGISITNQRGTSIYATASGQVVYAGRGLQGYGYLVIIKHNYDYLSAYAHNETLLVREHEKIKAGQKIAEMGDSGTDNVHLHFEIRYRGKSVDPLRYLVKR